MRDKSHLDQIERWALFVRENPNWKKELKKFLDAQLIMARRVYLELEKTEEGRKKIRLLKKLD
ncbi:MAG TPA: hypothetical protein VJB35_04625 [Candidatus Nanoarchaeia archaeon]|nr:hypothetical protein [Candidatus Nanoarchaeia archaeon]